MGLLGPNGIGLGLAIHRKVAERRGERILGGVGTRQRLIILFHNTCITGSLNHEES